MQAKDSFSIILKSVDSYVDSLNNSILNLMIEFF